MLDNEARIEEIEENPGRFIATTILDTIAGTGLAYVIGVGIGKFILPGLGIPGKILSVIGAASLGIFAAEACHEYDKQLVNVTCDTVEFVKVLREVKKETEKEINEMMEGEMKEEEVVTEEV